MSMYIRAKTPHYVYKCFITTCYIPHRPRQLAKKVTSPCMPPAHFAFMTGTGAISVPKMVSQKRLVTPNPFS